VHPRITIGDARLLWIDSLLGGALNCSKCGVEIAESTAYCSACGQPQFGQPRAEHARPAYNLSGGAGLEGAIPEDVVPGDAVPEDVPSGGEAIEDARELEPRAATSPPRFVYAGFWLRLFAYIIDSLVLTLTAGVVIGIPLVNRGAISPDNPWAIDTGTTPQLIALRLLILMVQWVYFALLESSPWQASLGKKLLGLQVTDLEGKRISFARASGRFFATLLSGFILLIGFIMIAFTQRKQALHDILTDCLVIKKA
jgi:uncharacterized RDD family membrane protein YckC